MLCFPPDYDILDFFIKRYQISLKKIVSIIITNTCTCSHSNTCTCSHSNTCTCSHSSTCTRVVIHIHVLFYRLLIS